MIYANLYGTFERGVDIVGIEGKKICVHWAF